MNACCDLPWRTCRPYQHMHVSSLTLRRAWRSDLGGHCAKALLAIRVVAIVHSRAIATDVGPRDFTSLASWLLWRKALLQEYASKLVNYIFCMLQVKPFLIVDEATGKMPPAEFVAEGQPMHNMYNACIEDLLSKSVQALSKSVRLILYFSQFHHPYQQYRCSRFEVYTVHKNHLQRQFIPQSWYTYSEFEYQ